MQQLSPFFLPNILNEANKTASLGCNHAGGKLAELLGEPVEVKK